MTLRESNQAAFNVLDPLPRERVGWWVEVYDADNLNTVLARVFHFKSLSFNTPESDIGYGTVTWSADDPLLSRPLPAGTPLSELLERPNYWRVFDNGVERFRFIHDGTVQQVVNVDGSQELVISGPDPAVFLEWATVLPSAYPADFSATPRTFTGVPWATVWLTLFNEAKARGVVPVWITPTFTSTLDSNLAPWGDTGTYAIPPGGNLLDLLRQMADTAGFKWQMRNTGSLLAAPEFGNNKASEVRFFEGHDVLVSNVQEERKEVRNDVYLQGGDGLISRAVDSASVIQWMRREAYVTVQEAQDASTRNTAVNTHLATTKQPVKAFTFQVDPFPVNAAGDSIGRRVFVDYALGDTIGYGPRATDGSRDYRLVDLAIEVDETSQVTLEITVQSRLERSIDRMRRLLKLALGGNYNPSSGGSGITAQVMGTIAARLQDLYLDDLADVTTASAANGQALVYNLGTGMWEPGDAGSSVYVDPSAPPTYDTGDLWYDTDAPTPGGGGGGGVSYPIDAAALHATYGDDFAAGSLDAKWTRRNIVSGDETFHDSDWLSVALSSGSAQQQYHQAAPTGDFTIVWSGSVWTNTANFMLGPMIIDSSGAGVCFSLYDSPIAAYMWVMSAYAYSSSGTSVSSHFNKHYGGERIWYALNKTGTNYKGRYSYDGANWSPWTPNQAWAGTVNRIGFGRIYGAPSVNYMNVDRFNVV